MNISIALRHRSSAINARSIFSSSWSPPTPKTTTEPPILWKPETTNSNHSVITQLLSWGRGSSGQLGVRGEEIKLYPSPVASLLLPPSFRLSPIPGALVSSLSESKFAAVEVGLSCGLFHSSLLVDGKFWIWGKGDGGRLGLGHENAVFVPTLNPHLDNVKCMALGGLHSVALTSSGQVFSWGYGGFGALGHTVYTRELIPRPVEGSWSMKIKHIATSGTHTAAITESGFDCSYLNQQRTVICVVHSVANDIHLIGGRKLYISNASTLRRLRDVLIYTCVSCMSQSCGFSIPSGNIVSELYTWGREEGDGRLGLGPGRGPDQAGGLSVPTKVQALSIPVVAVSCGGFFTMALTEDGQIWNWGANSNYELGRGNKVGGWKPQPISSLEGVCIIQMACGGYHSLALTDDGKVLSWGHGGHGQLGHSSIESQKIPTVIEVLADEHVVSIACGGSSSAAVTESGKLYMWGNAKDSQLGIPGLPNVQSSPVEVKFLMEDDGLGPPNVLSVAIGASHGMCLVSRSRQ